jgi:hypothetical protein
MRRLLAFALLLPTLAFGAVRNPDIKTGWKDVRWGAPPPANAVCKTDGVRKLCTVGAGKDQVIGDLLMNSVVLVFWNERLFAVKVVTEREPEAFLLYSALQTAYGKGQTDGVDAPVRWQGDRIAIKFAFAPEFRGATLDYTYLPIYQDMLKSAIGDTADRVTLAASEL